MKFTRWDAADYLKTDEDMALYFEICAADDPGDGSLIRSALRAISRARGMTQLEHSSRTAQRWFCEPCRRSTTSWDAASASKCSNG